MKRTILIMILVLIPSLCWGQYWGNRATEQSFETSNLHFTSHFLNTHGLLRFRDVAPGLVDDPFLGLHINPANLPRISGGNSLIYFDFRGDRTEAPIIQRYYSMPYYDYGWHPDPRWYSVARSEPEPIFSVGLLAYPFRDKLEKLFVGGTYQVIYKEEPYYTMPSWIYKSYDGYDAFGERDYPDEESIPVQERYYGKDELSTEAHLFSAFTGYPVTDELDLGVGLNTVSHSRDGGYINSRSDEYGQTDNRDYRYYNERTKNQDYSHFDFNAGLRYAFSQEFSAGIKIGYLSGEADQTYLTVDSSFYERGDSLVDSHWYYNHSRSRNDQQWSREGDTRYARVSFEKKLNRGRVLSGYYRYGKSDLDLNNRTAISSNSHGASRYQYSDRDYRYQHSSLVGDDRQSTGDRTQRADEVMLNLKWKLNRKTRVNVGVFYSRDKSEISSTEPVIAFRQSESDNWRNDTLRYSYNNKLFEVKRLEWRHNSDYRSIQIPVLVHLQFDRRFGMTLGVNRILERWKTSDVTTEYFTIRERTTNGDTETETNFAERYTQPERKYTEDYTALLANFEVALSPEFLITLMLDPETEGDFKINQWWLSFQLKM